jgi:hypothetical protein
MNDAVPGHFMRIRDPSDGVYWTTLTVRLALPGNDLTRPEPGNALLNSTELNGLHTGTTAQIECQGCSATIFLWVTRGGGLPPAGHTQRSQASLTAGGRRQSLTSEIRLTPLSQELPSARTEIAWELTPHTSKCQRPIANGVRHAVLDLHQEAEL